MGQLGSNMREVQRLIPSVNVGEYGPGPERPDDGGLYPLEEAGTYGPVPKAKHPGKWSLPQPYVPREKKPKTYASYNISEGCALHARVLNKNDNWGARLGVPRRRGSVSSNASSARFERAVSEPPQIKKQSKVTFVKRSVLVSQQQVLLMRNLE